MSDAYAENPYMGLRSMILNLKSKDLEIDSESYPHNIWGLVTETGMERGSYTLVALADGTTSLYYSSGGGYIGVGNDSKVQGSSQILLAAANFYSSEATMVDQFPLPKRGHTNFYFIGDEGVKGYSSSAESLGQNKDKLSKLFFAAHQVITTIREMEEEKEEN